jgi:hypothetical protein
MQKQQIRVRQAKRFRNFTMSDKFGILDGSGRLAGIAILAMVLSAAPLTAGGHSFLLLQGMAQASGKGHDDDHDDELHEHESRDVPARFGKVVRTNVDDSEIEVRYSDGWREEIKNGRYRLKNPSSQVVVSRPATNGDWRRLRRIAAAGR